MRDLQILYRVCKKSPVRVKNLSWHTVIDAIQPARVKRNPRTYSIPFVVGPLKKYPDACLMMFKSQYAKPRYSTCACGEESEDIQYIETL